MSQLDGTKRKVVLPAAENRRADPDMRGAECDRRLEVAAHAHGELREAVALGDLRQQREMRRRGRLRPAGCTSGLRSAGHSSSRQRATKPSASPAAMPAFCASSPVLTWTKSRRRLPCFCDLVGQLPRRACRGRRVWIDVEERHRLARLVGLQRPDQMQLEPGYAARSAGHLPLASCTRFSPNTRCPAVEQRLDRARRRRSWTRRPASRRRGGLLRRALGRGDFGAHDAKLFDRAAHAFFRTVSGL